jgi:hypothetical protein
VLGTRRREVGEKEFCCSSIDIRLRVCCSRAQHFANLTVMVVAKLDTAANKCLCPSFSGGKLAHQLELRFTGTFTSKLLLYRSQSLCTGLRNPYRIPTTLYYVRLQVTWLRAIAFLTQRPARVLSYWSINTIVILLQISLLLIHTMSAVLNASSLHIQPALHDRLRFRLPIHVITHGAPRPN